MSSFLARVEGLRTYFDGEVYKKLYEAEVLHVDRLVGQLIRELDALGLMTQAHVIFVSDHGEAFGEADVFGHGRSLHPVETRVPLFWKLPGNEREGTRVTTTVQLVDLLPTFRAITGKAPHPSLDGRVLSGILLGETADDDGFAFTEAGYIGTLGAQGVKYAARTRHRAVWLDLGFSFAIEFDRDRDPWENGRRRYDSPREDQLFDSLVNLALRAEAQRAQQPPAIHLDETQRERLRALGYR